MLLSKGKPSHIREIADLLRQQKGVLHAALSMSSAGRGLK
jgi:metal-responsive CopG/Arc/MetJ family transcriptional regulator